jgi:hypothetical protein
MPHLHIRNDATVDLDPSIDASGELDFAYGKKKLSDYEYDLLADHSSVETIRVTLHNFDDGTNSWKVSAIQGRQPWSVGANGVYFDFGWLTDFENVDVTATNTATGAEKTKLIRIKTQPQGSLPSDDMFGGHNGP